MNEKWWKQSIVYQVYPKSFHDNNHDGIGDLQGIIKKLDYLKDLGIDLIWLSPVYQSPMDDNGYDISDYYKIAPEFGTMEDLDELIEEARKRDIKIMMDLVINHSSDEHEWFIESKRSKNSPKRDWYIWRDPASDGGPPTNWRSVFGGSAWEYDANTNQYYLHVFSRKQPDLNWENKEVRQELAKMVSWWLDKGIGGFRVDAITFIKKSFELGNLQTYAADGLANIQEASLNQPGIHEFLHELREATFANYDIATVAEAPGVQDADLPLYVGENGHFNMLFEFNHVDLDLGPEGKWAEPVNWSLSDLKQIMKKSQEVYNTTGWGALYIENHDHPRSFTKFIRKAEADLRAQKMLAVFYMFMKGTPFIYQGQEIGMVNAHFSSIEDYDDLATIDQYQVAIQDGHTHEEALKAVWRRSRDNSRTPMQWDCSSNAGFTNGNPWLNVNSNYPKVNVENNIKDSESLYHFYKKLINLRKDSHYSESLLWGDYVSILEDHPEVFAYKRVHKSGNLVILCNFTDKETTVELDGTFQEIVLSNYSNSGFSKEHMNLKPYEAVVCLVD